MTRTLAVLSLLAIATTGLWALQRGDAVAIGVMTTVTVGSALSLWTWARQPMQQLRWDGQCWWLGLASASGKDVAQSGEVAVAMDLGAWLLLRFRADRPARWPRTHWLALRRAHLPGAWHALRCAVYSPRPPSLAEG